ncbi:MAG: class I SAM-dependent methyltransferase [Burkholderiales bacterium]
MTSLQDPDLSNGAVKIDYAQLYDDHAEYSARRVDGSFEQRMVSIEVEQFKVPFLVDLLSPGWLPNSVVEIGCGTGELIAAFPVAAGGTRTGLDISPANIAAAGRRFPQVSFRHGDFRVSQLSGYDCVILSDILEHVEDDAGFLRDAAALARYTLVNLPLENNVLNWGRNYGPSDTSGHLRKYSPTLGLQLFERAGLRVLRSERVWLHETPAEPMRRSLRRECQGSAYAGQGLSRVLRSAVMGMAMASRVVGRPLLSSNLFAIAESTGRD